MLRLIKPPVHSILSLEEVKHHLRVDHQDDDALITSLIEVVTKRLDGRDGILGRCLSPQTWELVLPHFPGFVQGHIQLPLPPTIAVNEIKYLDPNGILTTLDPEDYRVIEGGWSGALIFPTLTWPATDDEPDAVRIQFEAGYEPTNDSPSQSTVPEPIRQAMLLMIGDLYENRTGMIIGTNAQNLPFSVEALLAPYRMVPVA